MPVFDLFSYRQRVAEGDVPDVFVYDSLPQTLMDGASAFHPGA